jgi:hypothetical protein
MIKIIIYNNIIMGVTNSIKYNNPLQLDVSNWSYVKK